MHICTWHLGSLHQSASYSWAFPCTRKNVHSWGSASEMHWLLRLRLCTFGLCIGNRSSAAVLHTWALQHTLVTSVAVCAHLGFASEMHWFLRLQFVHIWVSASEMHWSLQLRSCGLCIGNALVFFSFGPAGSASEMHWFLRLQFCTLGICKMHWFSSASFSFHKVAHRTASGSANRKGR